jgi:predicted nucleic acid-binding protein
MKLAVADASALVELLLRTKRGRTYAGLLLESGVDLHVPFLCDVEVVSAMRGVVRRGRLDAHRASEALEDYAHLPLTRHPHLGFLERIFELRENFSAYDAAYVVLAEALDAQFLTGDRRLHAAIRKHTRLEPMR